jgi:hypothetical protein
MIVYHVIKKNVDGAYLLDKRNDIIYTDTIEQDAREIFNNRVINKSKSEIYDLVMEIKGQKYLRILCER